MTEIFRFDLAIDDMGDADSCRDICSGYRGMSGEEVLTIEIKRGGFSVALIGLLSSRESIEMADQRIIMKSGSEEIVVAVRHGQEWRSARDDDNDIGDFLNRIGAGAEISIKFDDTCAWPDPVFYVFRTHGEV